MGFEFFSSKSPAERARDHITQLGKVHASGITRPTEKPAKEASSRADLQREAEYHEAQARASAKDGSLKAAERDWSKAQELRRLLGA